jgi:mono/diheme cytochrome c family protein
MYHNGSTDARSVRSLMQFSLSPLATLEGLQKMEPAFRDIQQFLLSLEPPKYPLPVDEAKARRGEGVFKRHCASCHGMPGPGQPYPNKIIDLETIGTDPIRAIGIQERAREHYVKTWFGQERDAHGQPLKYAINHGYQAPPLDGVWATAPYFHNGSVPTVYDVLNSASRPARFTRSYRTDQSEYDPVKLGWKVTLVGETPTSLSAIDRRRIYDTSLPGRGNQGHTFGDDLTDEERWAVVEYLKTK